MSPNFIDDIKRWNSEINENPSESLIWYNMECTMICEIAQDATVDLTNTPIQNGQQK